MAAPPLTHHDILAIVAPFARRGRHVDLAATQRNERRIAFKAIEREGETETLVLECYEHGHFELRRTLTRADGLAATVEASGREPDALLSQVESVPHERHFASAGGACIARSYIWRGEPVLSRGVVQTAGLQLVMTVPAARRASAELTLTDAGPVPPDLPEDLLAVLGWNWARLIRQPGGWRTRFRLRGSAAQRTARGEAALALAGAHLAGTLSRPPAEFHDHHRAARWGVCFRRAIPLLTPVALALTVLSLPRFEVGENPGPWLLLYHVPTMLIALSFCLQELPAMEIPPLPRRLRANSWHDPAARYSAPARQAAAHAPQPHPETPE
jgi:hypothetical protein